MTMNLFLPVMLLAVLMTAMHPKAHADQVIAQEYPISNVTEVSAGGSGVLEVVQGDSETLRVEATSDVMKRVKVDLTKGKLSLGVKDANGNFFHWFDRNADQVKFIVQVKTIKGLQLIGAVQANIATYNGETFWLNNSGAAKANFADLTVGELNIESSGAANVTIRTLNSQKVIINLSGASNFEIKKSGAVQQLKLDASGASNYRGKPLFVANAHANASGASNIDIQVSETLNAVASGASNINYYGSAEVSIDASGASHINGRQ